VTEVPFIAIRLRRATKTAHHALDHHPLLAALLSPSLTRTAYGDALAALHGIFAATEYALAPGADVDFPHAPRLPALDADLAALGRAPSPCLSLIAVPDSGAARIGLLYVLEGSALGGQVLTRQIQATLGTDCPLRFFAGAGESAAKKRWTHFWRYAEVHCRVEDIPQAEAAACALFKAFQTHLDDCQRAKVGAGGTAKGKI
jgi:heme oxygenase